jgi:pimeloyl-ACP methyl ester carboxylesterase
MVRVGWGQDNPAFRQVFATLFVPEGTPEQHNWFTELARVTAYAEKAAQMEQAFFDIDVSDLATQMHCPTLVLHSRGDQMVPFAEGRLLADLIPQARFVPLESNNHVLLAHEPAWPHFLHEVYQFLGIF